MNLNKNGMEALSDDRLSSVAGGYGGQVISSGSFSSQTGTSLNLLVSWSAEADAMGQKALYVTVSSLSSNLQAAALPNSSVISSAKTASSARTRLRFRASFCLMKYF